MNVKELVIKCVVGEGYKKETAKNMVHWECEKCDQYGTDHNCEGCEVFDEFNKRVE